MGFIHETGDNIFGLEERRESFVILIGGDREEHGIFIRADEGVSGGIELSFERVADLLEILNNPAVLTRMRFNKHIKQRGQKR